MRGTQRFVLSMMVGAVCTELIDGGPSAQCTDAAVNVLLLVTRRCSSHGDLQTLGRNRS